MSSADTLPVVVFRIGDLTCAAPAARVREVLPRLPATRIPGVAGAVEGLVNLRGGLLTVIDGHLLLGRPAGPAADRVGRPQTALFGAIACAAAVLGLAFVPNAAGIALVAALLGWLRRSTLGPGLAAPAGSGEPSTLVTERP